MNEYISLNQIKKGETVTAVRVSGSSSTVRRLTDMGLVENSIIECVGRSPTGDPAAYLISGAVIAIRSADAQNIKVRRRENG